MTQADLMLRLEMQELQDRYIATIDNDRLEEWPELFVEDCLYEIMPRENEELGLPAPLMRCESGAMLRDRVLSLRHANIFEQPTYRHMVSGFAVERVDEAAVTMSCNYLVVNTSQEGSTSIYQAGRYLDRVVQTPAGWRFKSKRAIYDTLRVQTLLAYPI